MNRTRNAPQYWDPNSGPWMPKGKRVEPPRRWLRYLALIILLTSGICSAWPLVWPAADPDGQSIASMAERRPAPATLAPFVMERGTGDGR